METNRVLQFRAIVETGNLRKAADLLGLSHSGLSKSMKALEDDVGFKLFVPAGRGLAITDEGQALYARSNEFLDQIKSFIGRELTAPRETLRIGSFEVFTSQWVPRLTAEVFPQATIEVHELLPGRLEEALLGNRIDVGITYEPIARAGITYERITSLQMAPFARKGAFRNQDTLEIPFVVPVRPLEGIPSGVKGLDAWPEAKFKRHTPFGVDLLSTGLELVRQGLCAIFIPEFVARLHNESIASELRLEPLPLPRGMKVVKRDVFLLRRESTEEDANFRRIAKVLRRL